MKVLLGRLSRVVTLLTFCATAAAARTSPHLAKAHTAEKAKDYAAAISEYRLALVDRPTDADAALGLARTEESAGQTLNAYADFEKLFTTPGLSRTHAQEKEATTHLEALAAATAVLTVRPDPFDAAIAVDGADATAATTSTGLRLVAGPHTVKVTKPAFLPHEETVNVAAGEPRVLSVQLAPEPTVGHLSVREAQGRPLVLQVDGQLVGVLPWKGDLAPGTHRLEASSTELAAAPTSVTILRGGDVETVLTAAAKDGPVELEIAGGKGSIAVDGVTVGTGVFKGRLALGAHRVTFQREGFQTAEVEVAVTAEQTARTSVTLRPIEGRAKDPHASGSVTSLLLAGAVQLNDARSESETDCAALGSRCRASTPYGAGIFVGVGHVWSGFGFDVQLGALGDTGRRTYQAPAGGTSSYYFDRLGSVQSIRFRAAAQGRHFRTALAIGPGVAERFALLGYGSGGPPGSIRDESLYVSLGLNVEASVQWRFTASTALAIGALLWVENAGDDVVTSKGPAAGSFHVVRGSQVLLYPFLGLVFGP